jgi:hypothetical protein
VGPEIGHAQVPEQDAAVGVRVRSHPPLPLGRELGQLRQQIVACVIGDGEAETGPLATSWQSTKFLNPISDGAVLPILHLNGYKISNPTVLARIGQSSFKAPSAEELGHDYYQRAYSEMLTCTSTEWAPWHVLPADHKWFTRICAAAVIAATLIDIDPRYPVLDKAARHELQRAKAELEAEAPPGAPADPAAAESRT